jgi:hypothetical protein
MRKKFITSTGIILSALLLFSGCQKQTIEPTKTTEEIEVSDLQAKSLKDRDEDKCRLITLDWSEGGAGIWQFQYNNKGLADKWTIDYGYGLPIQTNDMKYDRNNRLIQSNEFLFGSNYVYHFYYWGDRLTRSTRASVEFPDQVQDTKYTYNKKGQNTRQDDENNDTHVLMYYDAMGNCTRSDLYFGTDLWYSDNYTFNSPVKNPRLNVPGVELGFPFYGTGGFTDKRCFTSNRTVIYDVDGTPFVFNDYDPSQTIIRTDNHNLPVSATYYDRVTESNITITFGYDNCDAHPGDDHHDNNRITTPSSNKSISPDNIKNQVRRILYERSKDMKEQISALRKQLRK